MNSFLHSKAYIIFFHCSIVKYSFSIRAETQSKCFASVVAIVIACSVFTEVEKYSLNTHSLSHMRNCIDPFSSSRNYVRSILASHQSIYQTCACIPCAPYICLIELNNHITDDALCEWHNTSLKFIFYGLLNMHTYTRRETFDVNYCELAA